MNDMARIGIDIRKINDFGIGTYIRHLVNGLAREGGGHEYVLLHPDGEDVGDLPGSMERAIEPSGLYSIREPFSLGSATHRLRLDLLHCPHYVTPFSSACPVAVTIHDIIHLLFQQHLPNVFARAYATYFMRRAAKKAAVIFTVSESSRRDILKHLPAEEDRIIVTPNGVDPICFESFPEEETAAVLQKHDLEKPYVLYVGNNKPHKNLPRALEAFRIFRKSAPQWHFALAGGSFADPTSGAALLQMVEEKRLADAIVFLGFLPRRELAIIYAAANIFFFPSLYEGFGLPPLEAMAAGVPVVCSDRSAMPEVLGDAPLYAEPDDVTIMSMQMRAATDEATRRRMVAAGQEQAKKFVWSRTVQLTLEGYERVLEKR